MPAGLRGSVTDRWGAVDFILTNPTDRDRQARALFFFTDRPDVQYGRDLHVPARADLSTWMLLGPAPAPRSGGSCEVQMLLYDRTDGKDRLILPPTRERIRSRGVVYRKPEPSTTILLDEDAPEPGPGQLPQPESPAEEAATLVRTFRLTRELSEVVPRVRPGPLPPVPEAFDGVDHFVIASGRIADDPAGLRALRRWAQRGGKVWVMLDLVDPEVLAPLLGDAIDFHLVDRVKLNTVQIELPRVGKGPQEAPVRQEHEHPVAFARVALPPGERVIHTVDGWPAWFTRRLGLGKVVFTALGARGWYRPRKLPGDRSSPYQQFPSLPVPHPPLILVADELQLPRVEEPLSDLAFRQSLSEEIGYSIVSRAVTGLIFAAFLLALLALGIGSTWTRRPWLLGLGAPAAAAASAAVFLVLAERARRSAPETVAVAQVVTAVPETREAAIRGLLAFYRPESGPVRLGAEQGGLFELDATGLEGQIRRFVLQDVGVWGLENLSLPAGVRFAPFRFTAPTQEPVVAVARFGPQGVVGKLTAGPFRDLEDLILNTPGGRNLAVRLGPDGSFTAGAEDVLAEGEFIAGALLSDQQQRRQELYRTFLKPGGYERTPGPSRLLAWARPLDLHFTASGARDSTEQPVGTALLVVPLRLERPVPGERVTIPGPFIPFRQMRDGVPSRPTLEFSSAAEMQLRFQVPDAVLPFQVERARLRARIEAPSRRLTIYLRANDKRVEVYRGESPLDPIRVDLPKDLLRLDEQGGLHVEVRLSDSSAARDASGKGEKWAIRRLEMEVVGQTLPSGDGSSKENR
jgi:hypothetical protein